MADLARIHGKPGDGYPAAATIDDHGLGSCTHCGAARTPASVAGGLCTVCGMME